MKAKIIIFAIILMTFTACQKEALTGIVYSNALDVWVKVDVYQKPGGERTLMETVYIRPGVSVMVELPILETWTVYTPKGCFRVIPSSVQVEEGKTEAVTLDVKIPMWY